VNRFREWNSPAHRLANFSIAHGHPADTNAFSILCAGLRNRFAVLTDPAIKRKQGLRQNRQTILLLNDLIESSVPCWSDFQDKATDICQILSFVGREEIDLVNCEIPGLVPPDPGLNAPKASAIAPAGFASPD